MVVKETNLLLFYFLYDRYFLKWFQIECQRNWWEAECIQGRRWRITHGSRDCSKKVTSVGSLVGSSFMFRGGRDGEQRGCPVVTLSVHSRSNKTCPQFSRAIFTGREEYNKPQHTEVLTIMASNPSLYHGLFSPSPSPLNTPLLLPLSA